MTQSPGPSALLAWTGFFELFREQEALAAGLPSHLEQGPIEVTNHAHDRHLFTGKMDLPATISDPFRQSRRIHHRFSPLDLTFAGFIR
jgi:hypothetical protein